MNIKLSLKRPLFYMLLPVLIILAFVGFPIPVPPPRPTKPSQEQAQPAEESSEQR
jgi:hypothetical protein